MTGGPTLAAVIPARRAARFIGEALASIRRQQGEYGFEVVVVDDASDDGTGEAARAADPGARVLRLESPSGSAVARNEGILATNAPLVAFLDADDRWVPEKTSLQMAVLERRPEVGLVFSDMVDVDSRGVPVGTTHFARTGYQGPPDLTSLFLHDMVSTPTVIVRREVLDRAGPFDATLPIGQDTDLWFRIARTTVMAAVGHPLVHRGLHGGNVTREALLLARCTEKVWGRYLAEALSGQAGRAHRVAVCWDRIRAHRVFLEGAAALREGRLAEGRSLLDRALSLHPGHRAARRLRRAARLGRPGLALLRRLFGRRGEA